MHTSELLWDQHHTVAPYPPGVLGVPALIPGTSFFPGGRGLWQWDSDGQLPPFPLGGIMVLGHDFHSETGYRASVARGAEARTQPTWRQLTRLVEAASVDPKTCFFTNVYMGLRAGSATTGEFPGARDAGYVERCLEFLEVQLSTMRPRVILTLGRFVPPLLARLSDDLSSWRGARSLVEIDRAGPVQRSVGLGSGNLLMKTAVAALTHPSLRHLSISRRAYRGRTGDAAELAMIAEVLSRAG